MLGSNYDRFFTRNTSATLVKAIPNGSYWWRVRAVTGAGAVSPWSGGMSIEKNWASAPALLAPAEGDVFSYPTDHFRLEWAAVPGAWKYLVSVATDPGLGSLVWSGGPIETQASAFTLSKPLTPDKTYYWGITPIDPAGNRGAPSAVRSFVWTWPSSTQPEVEDVADPIEIYDHEFSWDAVPGAAGYEVEINSSSDWAPGSKVCCDVNFITKVTTIGTTFTPKIVLPNNYYYWRVRAVDPSRNAGIWNVGPEFFKSFDNVLPSVDDLRMLDNPFPTESAYETSTPIVAWDAVPGASAYEVEVTRFANGCQWTATLEHWKTRTATTSWTPLGSGWNGRKPYGSDIEQPFVSTDFPSLVAGHAYCVRVTALDRASDGVGAYVRSAETYLPDADNPAFVWTGPPSGAACSPTCSTGAIGKRRLPASGSCLDGFRDAALPLEAAAGSGELLRHRRQGSRLHEHRRLRLHQVAGVRAANRVRAEVVSRRDDRLLLGRPAGDRRKRRWGGHGSALQRSGSASTSSRPRRTSSHRRTEPCSRALPASTGLLSRRRAGTAFRYRAIPPSQAPSWRTSSRTRPCTRA